MKILFLTLIILLNCLHFAYCEKSDSTGTLQTMTQSQIKHNVNLFLLRCGSCHPVMPPPSNGPPLIAVTSHYKGKYRDFHSFKKAVTGFIKNPSEEKSLMPEAIEEFYLMFKMSFDEKELDTIVSTMWHLDKAYEWLQRSYSADTLAGVALGDGGRLFTEKCGACHSFEPPPLNGPPARGLTKNYRRQYGSFPAFQKAMIAFVQNPQKDKAVMPHAVENFGLMQKMAFDKKDLEVITEWLWDTYGQSAGRGGGPGRRGRGMQHVY